MKHERAVLAGGCFWGMQDLLRHYNGVISTRVFRNYFPTTRLP
jgi:peptide-methionine (S)-S-oxide reductase